MQSVAETNASPAVSTDTNIVYKVAPIAAILLGIIFLVSGGWKVLDPFKTGELLEQAKVPAGWGTVGAAALGVIELLAAFLLFVPSYRRWGGILGSALIVFFIAWIGYYYQVLVGKECSCFPIIKRSIGPNFFVSDAIMLLLGVIAFMGARRVGSIRVPAALLAGLAVVASASYTIHANQRSHIQVPTPAIVDGKATNLAEGKVLLFFYDPSCMHCDAAAKFMSTLEWNNTKIVAIPTINPQWTQSFLHDTHLNAGTSLELDKLKKAFPFVDPPYGVALVDGQVKQTFGQAAFNAPSPKADWQKLGFVK